MTHEVLAAATPAKELHLLGTWELLEQRWRSDRGVQLRLRQLR